jgi:two-component system KDP operon response regulator KdpE
VQQSKRKPYFSVGDTELPEGRILVVDDEPQIRRVLHSALLTAGYEVVDAGSGRAALEALRAKTFDLVLLDINMPEMDGLETCRIIRSSSEISIIMLTVRNTEKDKIESLDAGADDYVTKPFSAQELLARIRAALRRTPFLRDTNGTVIKVDAMEIHLAKRKVTVGGVSVRLTPKEFDLLHYLVINANVPLAHGKILQAVWGPDYGGQVEYLRVFVKQLRKKLEPEPAKPRYIVTEHWLGYRFQLPEEPHRGVLASLNATT